MQGVNVVKGISDDFIIGSFIRESQLWGVNIQLEEKKPEYVIANNGIGNHYCYVKRMGRVSSILKKLDLKEQTGDPISWTLLVRQSIPNGHRYFNKVAIKVRVEFCLSAELPLANSMVEDEKQLVINKVENEDGAKRAAKIIAGDVQAPHLVDHIIAYLRGEDSSIRCYLVGLDVPILAVVIKYINDQDVVIESIGRRDEHATHDVVALALHRILTELCFEGKVRAFVRVHESQYLVFKKLGFVKEDSLLFYQYNRLKTQTDRTPLQNFSDHGILKSKNDYLEIVKKLEDAGLPKHVDLPKNWDTVAALDMILKYCGTNAEGRTILDAGGETYSGILPLLEHYNFKNLYCINLTFKRKIRRRSVLYEYGDITATAFKPEMFDAVVCLSVIEHGVDISKYLKEMYRILKPGGILITSTDFWCDYIDVENRVAYGCPVKIFNAKDISDIISECRRYGFATQEELDLSCKDKVVQWLGLEYTFIYFTLHKKKE